MHESATSPLTPHRASTVYGPVLSWRFGWSLGVDPILEVSTCSFNCIYCQLGNIQRVTAQRGVFLPVQYIRDDLRDVDWSRVDVVTISGSGEPTLAANLDEIIAAVRGATDKPIHILTNATLFDQPDVRRQAALADVVACKLDAPDDATLRLMNRPVEGVSIEGIIEGIAALRSEFGGQLVLQIMLMPANIKKAEQWIGAVRRVAPDEIHLNTPRRPYPLAWYLESRGDHELKYQGEKRTLRTVGRAEAERFAATLRAGTGVKEITIFRE